MVLTLMLPARALYPQLYDVITPSHVDKMAKIILLTGMIVSFAYIMEFFIAYYSGSPYERYAFLNRCFGEYWWGEGMMILCNVLAPQLFWFKRCRHNVWVVFTVCMFVNVGMWFERFTIIAVGLTRDFLPSSWGTYHATFIEVLTFVGTLGIFVALFLLFVRYLPLVAMAEVKGVLPQADPHFRHQEQRGDYNP